MEKFIKTLFREKKSDSIAIIDQEIIQTFFDNPANTFLISFPRTGSHWLRMVMELYFERPSLVRVFYYPNRHDYLTLHTHDMDLDVIRQDVIYLYRQPVDTIYSQMSYEKENLDDDNRVKYWSNLYGRHLEKWLITEKFTTYKTVIRYDRLRDMPDIEFAKVCAHFGQELDAGRLAKYMSKITREKVKEKTPHDPSVITLDAHYEDVRQTFHQKHTNLVWDTLLADRAYLSKMFD